MRKLKIQVQMSVDGFIGGPNREMDWLVWNWDEKIKEYINELTDTIDTILLGRKMAEGFVSHWTGVLKNPEDPAFAFAKKMVDTPKFVFSKTIHSSPWANTVIANGNISEEVNRIKNENGKDIIVYGGASFDSSLIAEGLIDEFHLFINPAAIGNGLTIFKNLRDKQKLKLIKSIGFDCGIVVMHYERA